MEEIKLTPEELKKVIDNGKKVGEGGFGTVFTYKGNLIKLDNKLYKLLKVNDPIFTRQVVLDRYKWGKEDFSDRVQLEELYKRQPNIRTKVPNGIITIKDNDERINNVSPGITLPYFSGYDLLNNVSKDDYKKLLILLKKVFEDIRELADNEIAQEDLFMPPSMESKEPHSNIIQKGNDARIIDMSGPLVKVGKDYTGPEYMYNDFANLINYYYELNGLKPIYDNSNIDEKKLQEMLDEFDKQTRKR